MKTDRWLGALLFISSFALLGGFLGSCTDSEPNIGANKQALGEDGGDGSAPSSDASTGYVLVDTCAELEAISTAPTLNYRLTADIDCTGYGAGNGNGNGGGNASGFTPIVDFAGTLDGGGHYVTGLFIEKNSAKAGLFSKLDGATVSRLGILDAQISGGTQVGCLAGFAQNATVSEVTCRGAVLEGKKDVGGLIGKAMGTTISDSYVHADIGCLTERCGLLVGDAKQGSWTHGYGAVDAEFFPSRAYAQNAFVWNTTFFLCDGGSSGGSIGGCDEPGGQEGSNLSSEAFLTSQGWDFDTTWALSADYDYACLQWEPGCGDGCSADDTSCNGQDDDCDGAVDEDFVTEVTVCGVGGCVRTGVASCVGGSITDSCTPGTPAADDASCNLVDDDCDGATDEEYLSVVTSCGDGICLAQGSTSCVDGIVEDSCEPGTPAANDSTCDDLDNDCDTATDEGYVSLSTTCGEGICSATGSTSCASGTVSDSCQPGSPEADDASCDALDSDCDGAIDEAYPITSTTCGVGACAAEGDLRCLSGSEVDSCEPGAPAADDSVCNGIDDDCNATVDEDYVSESTSCGVGACSQTGSTSCVDGSVEDSCTPGTPAASDATCDGVDDDCDASNDEDYTPESTSCGVGACAAEGATSCVDGSVEDSCTPGTPAASDATCDGVDDDCDGNIDEDYASESTSCGVGACGATGATSCVNGTIEDSCAPGAPAASDATCDGIDDNCDGTEDEGYVSQSTSCGVGACGATGATSCVNGSVEDSCEPGTPAVSDATCDGVDDDCDGIADDDYVSQSTSCGVGACGATGATSCVNGTVEDSCTPGSPAPSDATCDGIDDDCDGIADDDYVSQSTSCGVGACGASGSTSCLGGTVQDNCTPGSPAPSDATCDGIDDDCDGVADDEYVSQSTSCGVGACGASGSTSCVGGAVQDSCTPGSPAALDATCDGIDDDCDGIADDDYVSQSTSCGVGACGATGATSCVGGAVQDSCTTGTPAADDATCDGVDDDCDGIADEDCEQCVPSASDDSTCDGVDDDCDGIADEDFIGAGTRCPFPSPNNCSRGRFVCIDGSAVDSCSLLDLPDDTTCDRFDDDCDGFVDESWLSSATTCGDGACASTGSTVCDPFVGERDTCVPGTPEPSDATCDLVDNDCDGAVDEEAVPSVDDPTCDGVDDDCDGAFDENFAPSPTTCGLGVCEASGVSSCVDGAIEDSCTPATGPASDSTCDGVDDDCDGLVDDDYMGEVTSCGVGACAASGSTSCSSGAVVDSCSPGSQVDSDDNCDGIDGDCDGSVDEGFVPEPTSCGVGVCSASGATTCVGGTLSDSCSPGSPLSATDATCDGIDDNCSGEADEDFVGAATTCTDGVCDGVGEISCIGGQEVDTCEVPAPAADDATCDAFDDDCDGEVDEDFSDSESSCGVGACERFPQCAGGEISCVPGVPSFSDASCDGIDDDCDGLTDEDFLGTSSCGVGACQSTGTATCQDGAVVEECTPGTPASSDATCDGIDDDCNGVADEDYVSASTSCGQGACAANGVTSCVAGNVQDSCSPGTPAPSDATCNNIDDDCNGSVDEDFVSQSTTCGVGACGATGSTSCVAGVVEDSCAPTSPSSSTDPVCDGVDEDCDGAVDEDFSPQATICGVGVCASAGSTVCVAGAVQDTCQQGSPIGSDTSCNGFDDDCDGATDEAYVGSPTSCGVGECATTGTYVCVSGVEVDGCLPEPPAPDDSICDGFDEDCDGAFDEDFAPFSSTCGVGACGAVGSTSCVSGSLIESCTPGAPTASDDMTCDGVDDDCDGYADEDCADFPQSLEEIAPPLSLTGTTTFRELVDYYYQAARPIQLGLNEAAFEDHRISGIFGYVRDRAGAPLQGVRVSVEGHPEHGYTLTRVDGRFDMAVNGGGRLAITYERSGYITVQRHAKSSWNNFTELADVVMSEIATTATPITLAAAAYQDAAGDTESDAAGTRTGRILIPPGTTGQVVAEDGTVTALPTNVSLRIKEFTVGPDGADAMPGPLPYTSGYTYAMDLSLDEAPSGRVEFSTPLPYYVENFLGFPIGQPAPLGYYDNAERGWIPAPTGVVLKILSISGSMADIDVTGDSIADPLSVTGISDAERAELATLYSPGAELMRVELPHFTSYDINMGIFPPADAEFPEDGTPGENVTNDNDCNVSGSVIGCTRQSIGESVSVAGTPFLLHHNSERMPGNHRFNIEVPLNKESIPASVKGIEVVVSVAGRTYSESVDPVTMSQQHVVTIHWDGRDAANRIVQGTQQATVELRYAYDAEYSDSGTWGTNGGGNISVIGMGPRRQLVLPTTWKVDVGGFQFHPRGPGIGGFDLDVHHTFDHRSGELIRGDGTRRRVEKYVVAAGRAGNGQSPSGSGLADGVASEQAFPGSYSLRAAADGSVYFVNHNAVRRLDFNGTVTRVAGLFHSDPISSWPPNEDNTPALDAVFQQITDLELKDNGDLFIFDGLAGRVYKLDAQTGAISTVLGGGSQYYSAAGESLDGPDVYLRPGSLPPYPNSDPVQGHLAYDEQSRVLYVWCYPIDQGGLHPGIVALGGDGQAQLLTGPWPSGGLSSGADLADVQLPNDVQQTGGNVTRPFAVLENGLLAIHSSRISATESRLYYVTPDRKVQSAYFRHAQANDARAVGNTLHTLGDRFAPRVHRLDQLVDNGRFDLIAGLSDYAAASCGTSGCLVDADGQPATRSAFRSGYSFAVGPGGDVFVSDSGDVTGSGVIHRFASSNFTRVPSEDGSLLYEFDDAGRHLRTFDSITNNILWEFSYDAEGRLSVVSDRDGVTTTIVRDSEGLPLAIDSHYGQRTTFGHVLSGYIDAVSNELGETTSFQYSGTLEGYLTGMTDPLGRDHDYSYVDARIERDTDPLSGYQELTRSPTTNPDAVDGHEVNRSTALERTTKYDEYQDEDGFSHRDVTNAAGFTTRNIRTRDGDSATTYPDGTLVEQFTAPDARFKMGAPFVRASSTTLPSGQVRSVQRSQSFVLVSENDPLSVSSWTETSSVNGDSVSSMSYDASSRTYSSASPEGRTSTTQLDALGRVSRVSVPGIAPVDYTYDSDGRIETITQTSATDGTRTTTYSYDTDGFLQSVTAPSLRQTSYTYDAVGRPLVTTLPDSEQLSTTWDAVDNLKSIAPPGRSAHNFNYTRRDQVQSYEPPDAGTATGLSGQSYDLDRAPRVSTLMDGRKVDIAYDSAGRVDAVTIARGSYDFLYSPVDGKLDGTTNPEGDLVAMGYDGPLVTDVTWSAASGTGHPGASVSFGYDNHFRVTSIGVDSEVPVLYSYDQDGYITAAAGMTVTRDAGNGLLTGTSITSGSGNVTTSRAHNDFGEAITMNATYAGGDLGFAFSYDVDGRIGSRQETSGASSTAQTYEYDLRGRLTDVYVDSVLTYEYDYDANGNRVDYTGPDGTVSATYDAQDRLLTYGANSYTYNDHGQVLTKTDVSGTTTYDYDELGNLVSVTLPDSTLIEYVIDALGRRVAKKVNGTLVRQWVYQDALNPVAEYDGSGNLIQRFVYATRMNVPDLIIRGGTTYRVIADQVGSVRRIVEVSTGAVAQELTYSPFGKVLGDSSPGWQPFAFAGGHYDNHTKLVRFGARDYDAEVGRWTAKDSAGFMAGSNGYAYSYNAPVHLVDPSGRIPILIPIIVIGGAMLATPSSVAAPATSDHSTTGPSSDQAMMSMVGTIAIGEVASIAAGAAFSGICGAIASRVANPVPKVLARVVPGKGPYSTLGAPGADDVFVTAADDIAGMSAKEISERLTIDPSDAFTVIEFPTPASGLASPVGRTNPGFVGGGKTAGGAREFVLPNGPVPGGAKVRVVE